MAERKEKIERMINLIEFSVIVDVPAGKILGINQTKSVVNARRIYWKLLFENYKLPLEEIAEMSRYELTDIIDGIRKVNEEIALQLSTATYMWNKVMEYLKENEE